jgi:hypothetical protein
MDNKESKLERLRGYQKELKKSLSTENTEEILAKCKEILCDGEDLNIWNLEATISNEKRFLRVPEDTTYEEAYEAWEKKQVTLYDFLEDPADKNKVNFGLKLPNPKENLGSWILELAKKLLDELGQALKDMKDLALNNKKACVLTVSFVSAIMVMEPRLLTISGTAEVAFEAIKKLPDIQVPKAPTSPKPPLVPSNNIGGLHEM